ncbi:MAG: methyl-accepting chemotaxis protein [Pseudobutyrivibrio ruminis]|nr:methyl-accepting chemotaxis protein [Pseudobutyrivibrio ruminis]
MKKEKVKSTIKFKDSIKTKLVGVLIAVASIPLIVSLVISYISSTNKAFSDAQDSLEWQAWYMEDMFSKIIDKNVAAMSTFASAPSTVTYLQDPTAGVIPDSAMLSQMNAINELLGDDNPTVITGKDGMQILRTAGDCVDVSDREYFKQVQSGTPIYVSDVITSKSTGARQITIAIPVLDDTTGEFLGCVQRNYDMVDLHEILAAEFEDAFVVDRTGFVAAHSQYIIGEDHEEEDRNQSNVVTMEGSEGFYMSTNTGKGYDAYVAWVEEPNTTFRIAVAEKSTVVMASARRSATIIVIIGLAMLVVAIFISLFMARSFTEPLSEISVALKDLSNGKFTKVRKYARRNDEFGAISKDTNTVIERLSEIVSNIKTSAVNVGSSSSELSNMASQISTTAEGVSNAVGEISQGATQQAEEIQTAAESTGKIGDAVESVKGSSTTLSDIAGKMKEASEISSQSLESLQNSSIEMTEKIDEISNAISRTQEAVNTISEKVEGISGIATQTNLLSLNASIEAARAGDAGKGFAVVAEEIRKLADDSDSMASEIKVEMERLLEEASAAVEAAKDVKDGNFEQQEALGETINSINGMLDDINKTVSGVALISQGADICDESKNAVLDMMSALSAISEENAASSQETETSMDELASTVGTLAESANALKEISDKLNEEMKFFTEE